MTGRGGLGGLAGWRLLTGFAAEKIASYQRGAVSLTNLGTAGVVDATDHYGVTLLEPA